MKFRKLQYRVIYEFFVSEEKKSGRLIITDTAKDKPQ